MDRVLYVDKFVFGVNDRYKEMVNKSKETIMGALRTKFEVEFQYAPVVIS